MVGSEPEPGVSIFPTGHDLELRIELPKQLIVKQPLDASKYDQICVDSLLNHGLWVMFGMRDGIGCLAQRLTVPPS